MTGDMFFSLTSEQLAERDKLFPHINIARSYLIVNGYINNDEVELLSIPPISTKYMFMNIFNLIIYSNMTPEDVREVFSTDIVELKKKYLEEYPKWAKNIKAKQ